MPQGIPENLPQSPKDEKKQPATMMLMENLMMQLAQTRKQLHLKDKQMHQLNLYVQEVINENAQLQMRL